MKKHTDLLVCLILLFLLMISLFTPIEKFGHEAFSLTIDLLQPDETFQTVQMEPKLKSEIDLADEKHPDFNAEKNNRLLAQVGSSLTEEASHDFS